MSFYHTHGNLATICEAGGKTRAQDLWLCQWRSQPCIGLGHVQFQGARQNSKVKAANPTRLKAAHPPKLLNNP
jgi:hypothetical protein